MRCEDIVKELSAPSDSILIEAVAVHLDDCPSCANWGHQVNKFDQLWAETALPDPVNPMESWDRVWNRIQSQRLMATTQPATIPFQARPRPRFSFGISRRLLVSAAAAAAVIGFGLTQPTTQPVQAAQVSLDDGQIGFIHVGDSQPLVETLNLDDDDSNQLGIDLAILSHFEGIAQ